MGNANCYCSHISGKENSTSINFENINVSENNIPKVKSIFNSSKYNKPKENLYYIDEKRKREFELKISQFGTFISEAELEASLSDLVKQKEKELSTGTFPSPNANTEILNNIFYEPPIKFNNGQIYKGEWNYKGQKNGFGINISPEGSLYKGYWLNDLMNGYGIYIDSKGNYYKGNFKHGITEGEGELMVLGDEGLIKYIGYFENDVINGVGSEEILNDKTKYVGNFVNGVKEGKGKLIFDTGTYYEGDFKDGKYNGNGKMVYEDGREYIGEYKDNQKHGKGVFKWKEMMKYDGEYRNDLKNGSGTFYWDEDRYYSGNWLNDKQHGEGCIYNKGKVIKGIFRFGKLIYTKE